MADRGGKKGKTKMQKFKYLKNEKSFLDEIKNIFHSFWIVCYLLFELIVISLTNYLKNKNLFSYLKILMLTSWIIYNEHNQTNEFLDSLASNSFIPLILQPSRITNHSNTLIDNIFSNAIDPAIISGNLTATISDHLHELKIIPNMFGNISGNKSNIHERDSYKFDW